MARILITGSADGLGRLTAEALHAQGHHVIVHARNAERAAHLRPLPDQGASIVIGDFADRGTVRRIAAELVEQAPLDAVIHNAGVWSERDVLPGPAAPRLPALSLCPGGFPGYLGPPSPPERRSFEDA
jgi:NAD(P)-dependent dehydrogenase (short-subunit alcohol dehydrogenase family)